MLVILTFVVQLRQNKDPSKRDESWKLRLKRRFISELNSIDSHVTAIGDALSSQHHVRVLYGRNDLHQMFSEINDVDMVLFFVRWCSHCQKYVPKLIRFAEDIQGWWPVLHIGAMDCYDNAETCSEYGVNAYPEMKLFWKAGDAPRSPEGESVNSSTDPLLRAEIIDFIEKHIKLGVPSRNLPDLNPSSAKCVSDLWLSMPSNVKKILAVIEPKLSYVGIELILDLSGFNSVRGIRFIVGVTPAELKSIRATSLVLLERAQEQRLLVTVKNTTEAREMFKSQLEKIGIRPRQAALQNPLIKTGPKDSKTSVIKIAADPRKVYVDDIETGLRYMLHSELTLVDEFNSTQLDTLRIFIGAIALYIPLPGQTESYLRRVHLLLVRNRPPLKAATFQSILKNATKGFSFRDRDFIGCKGSEPNKRGYPCSLWIIFHLMTVGCYEKHLQGNEQNPYKAIRLVRDYVLNFFTCKNCVSHFAKAAANLDSELDKPANGVLWLWKTHNDVNVRLKLSKFSTRKAETFSHISYRWRVLEFLVTHYGPGNIYDGTLRQRAFDWVLISIILVLLGVLAAIIVTLCQIPRAEDIEKYVEETSDVPAKNDAIMKSTSKQTAAVTDTTPTN
ncbi:sulfhydryl oxidase 1-like isoform X2 [Varroa jacobsoni]|uniref:sulfhydryl oxidase 1-like isoform X2 n=1 Tax=Varroa jacobsoni TaxID=62625 RepID=UPI000BF6B9FD|nr:sulfhydryl oxidase 1-like isoform X2 [Varroa jacobsoni]